MFLQGRGGKAAAAEKRRFNLPTPFAATNFNKR
jgi:hypothetical protein